MWSNWTRCIEAISAIVTRQGGRRSVDSSSLRSHYTLARVTAGVTSSELVSSSSSPLNACPAMRAFGLSKQSPLKNRCQRSSGLRFSSNLSPPPYSPLSISTRRFQHTPVQRSRRLNFEGRQKKGEGPRRYLLPLHMHRWLRRRAPPWPSPTVGRSV